MAYEHLEEFLSRGDEKFLGPLSLLHLIGIGGGGVLGYEGAVLIGAPLLISIPCSLLMAGVGLVMMLRMQGMSLLMRLAWWMRYRVERLLAPSSQVIDMDRLTTSVSGPQRLAAIGPLSQLAALHPSALAAHPARVERPDGVPHRDQDKAPHDHPVVGALPDTRTP